MRVTLDSNIYVSALQFGGKPLRVLQMGLDGELDIAVSEQILDETLRVLHEKFNWTTVDLQDAGQAIQVATYRVAPTESIDAVPDDPDDNRVLECAVAGNSEVIVTGDLDLLRLGMFRAIRIQRAADFLDHWESATRGG